jgi:hypothetical protein
MRILAYGAPEDAKEEKLILQSRVCDSIATKAMYKFCMVVAVLRTYYL